MKVLPLTLSTRSIRLSSGLLTLGLVGALSAVAPAHSADEIAASSDFTITELGSADVRVVDTEPAIGDDGGFVAITTTQVLVTGDDGLAGYDHALTAPANRCDPVIQGWRTSGTCSRPVTSRNAALFSDLRTQSAYLFDMSRDIAPKTISGFWPVAPYDETETPASTRVSLSEPIVVSPDFPCTVTASGWGRAVIWDRCAGVLYDIALPSGIVTIDDSALQAEDLDLGSSEASNPFPVRGHGVVEVIDGSIWLALAVGGTAIERISVQEITEEREVIRSFDTSDIYAFTVSPQAGMWCAHIESGTAGLPVSPVGGEPLYCASATAETPDEQTDEPDGSTGGPGGSTGDSGGSSDDPSSPSPSEAGAAPELANTGSTATALLIALAGAFVVGGAILVGAHRSRVHISSEEERAQLGA